MPNNDTRNPVKLAQVNAHERDSHITFDEGPHIYTIDGDSGFTSVTTWNHSHFEKFNSDFVIDKMMKSKNWSNNKLYGKTPVEIKEVWEKNRDEAAHAGTDMHFDIECYYNDLPVNNESIEYQYFKNFEAARTDPDKGFGKNLKAYRTEWMVYHKELRLAGSIDMVYEDDEGYLYIYDWKRSKEIKKNAFFGKSSTNPVIEHIPDSNYWHYSLQLNVYKYILEEKYGKQVKDLYLVCLHPNNKNGNFQRIKVPHLKTEIIDLVNQRQEQLSKNE